MIDALQAFRATHEHRVLDIDGDAWAFIDGGTADRELVILGGGGSSAQSMFTVNAALEATARVVSVGIPAVTSTRRVLEGLESVFDHLHLRRPILLGHSLGGAIAQAFAVRHAERVRGLVLSNSALYLGVRAVVLPAFASAMAHVPRSLLVRLITRQLDRLTANAPNAAFWRAFFRDELSQPGSATRVQAHLALVGDLARFFRRNPIAGAVQSLPVLIISSVDDRGFTRAEVKHLAKLYPRSTSVTFPAGTAHLSFLMKADDYVEAVRRFVVSNA